MKTQQIQNTLKGVQRTTGNLGWWLGLGILLFGAALALNNVSRTAATIPNTGSPSQVQTVPDASMQSVANYLQVHSIPYAQTVPDAAVQSVMDYIRLHSNDLSLREYDLGERYGVTPTDYAHQKALREYWLGERYGQTP